ncbi:MAG: GntR family transcriptional regulator [Chloroflexi bacterium]|nr:GntR family transcriptional regulator [Chloroflexota bacterium]
MLDLRSLSERVHEYLVERILSGVLVAGQRIDAEDLSRALGVSRTPIKDALARLAAEGLVEISPRRGTAVSTVTLRDVEEIFDVRRMIMLYASEGALGNATSADRQRLREMLGHLESYIVGDDYTNYAVFLGVDHELHSCFVELAGNGRLSALYQSTRVHMSLARFGYAHGAGMTADAVATHREHNAMVAAFEQGSLEALKAAINNHIDNRVAWYRRAFEAAATVSGVVGGQNPFATC